MLSWQKSRLVQFRSGVISNCVHRQLLHAGALITKCVGRLYYKMPQLLYQNEQVITKCILYFKMRRCEKMWQDTLNSN